MRQVGKVLGLILLGTAVWAEFSFFMIDNFESGQATKWYRFGNVQMTVEKNPSLEGTVKDIVQESCGEYALRLKGSSLNWFVGGCGYDIGIDASPYTRLQMDVYGSETGGKMKIELFDDDNGNESLEQDAAKDWMPTKDDKWVAEVPVLGPGFTRVSIPFSAFRLENPGNGDGIWNPEQKDGSGGLLKIQLILITGKEQGEVDCRVDNILLTY
ncbi:MAG: hypothetical protein ABIH50_00050 [bacterium]